MILFFSPQEEEWQAALRFPKGSLWARIGFKLLGLNLHGRFKPGHGRPG
jgi:hypothetical protein